MAKKHFHSSPYSEGEERILRKMWPDHTCAQIAKKIGRTVDAVRKKAIRLGLRKK